jgi:hypothetical protein
MGLQQLSDGFLPNQKDSGREASSTWLSASSLPLFSIDTGDNGAGNGGNGYFSGYLIDSPYAAFEPLNVAQGGAHGSAIAHQTNVAFLDQSATQIAGIGGDGGDDNAAIGGSASGAFGSSDSGAIATGDNSAGTGGDGIFQGAMVHAPVAVFSPVNIAVAGSHGSADAHQSNSAQIYQPSFQFAGNGGSAGNGNTAAGGDVSGDGTDAHSHAATGTMPVSGTMLPSGSGPTGLDSISSGDNHAGNGGDGYFSGSLVHTAIAVYDPINIAVAGYGSSSHADQSNNVVFDQSAVQMAGIGGNGGNGNAAIGGDAGGLSSLLGLIGSDVIATGGNSAGSGGDGHFTGSLVDLNIAIYAPINIAVAGPNSTADAHQTNNVEFDQGAIQIAGVGGDGGHGNAALGGDAALHLLSDLHVLSHA